VNLPEPHYAVDRGGWQKSQMIDLGSKIFCARPARKEMVDVSDHGLRHGALAAHSHRGVALQSRVDSQCMEQGPNRT